MIKQVLLITKVCKLDFIRKVLIFGETFAHDFKTLKHFMTARITDVHNASLQKYEI